MGPNPKDYGIHLADPYTDINELLAGQLEPKDYSTIEQQNSHDMELADNERAIHLKEVKINGNNDDSFYDVSGKKGVQIELGVQFMIPKRLGNNFFMQNYMPIIGLTTYILRFNGINGAQEFYPADYSKKLEEKQYLSTLYWKHLVKISSVKDAELSFYTGDITGKFKIVIQGITGNDVTYGETTFNVTKPK